MKAQNNSQPRPRVNSKAGKLEENHWKNQKIS